MIVALTLTPALAFMLLPKSAERARSPLAHKLQRGYRALLPRMLLGLTRLFQKLA